MKDKVIVLVTTGRGDSVYTAKVVLFDVWADANEFVDKTVKTGKHWVNAEIAYNGEEIELGAPE